MNYLKIVTVCVLGCIIPMMLPVANNVWYFTSQTYWSILIILLVTTININKIVLGICVVEFGAILTSMLAAIDYLTHEGFFYRNYETFLGALIIIEVIILLIGAPYNGLFNWIRRLGRPTDYGNEYRYRDLSDNKVFQR